MREGDPLRLLLTPLILRWVGRRPRLLMLLLPTNAVRRKVTPWLATPPPPRLLLVDGWHVYRRMRRMAVSMSASPASAVGMIGHRLVAGGGMMVRRRADGVRMVLVLAVPDDPTTYAVATA